VSRALTYKWVKQGLLRSVQMPGCVRIDEDDLEAFIENRKVGIVLMRR
jgi:excisionase family DNA binding protein